MSFFRCFVAIGIFCGSAEAANIHAIVVCDTLADSIGASVTEDLKKVHQELVKISANTHLKLQEKQFTSKDVNGKILDYIKHQTFGNDDVVLFFFSGHGYRTDTKHNNIWPNMYLTPENIGIDFYLVVKTLAEKEPRLIIAIADCCNNIIPEEFEPVKIKRTEFYMGASSQVVRRNYQNLFLNHSGTIIMSSSKPGEYSWGTRRGGLFTLALFESLNKEILSPQLADWYVLLDRASLNVVKRDLSQTPQYETNLGTL
jgi:hypothetical protein